MTVSNTVSRNQYTASSGQTVFPYTFEVFVSSDITVLQNDTTLSEGSNYSVSGVGVDAGGNITLTVGATTGDIITIYRSMELDRTTDYQNSGDFLAQEVNDDFDRLWLAAQQGDENNSRAIVKPVTDAASISMELPEAATRVNTFLAFDATGAVTVVPAGDSTAPDAITRQQFTGDGSTTVFTLAFTPGVFNNSLQVYVDGVHQSVTTYSTSGTTLTFSEAPPVNAGIEVVFIKLTDIGETDSSLVSYVPAGTGAVGTTVQTKLRESVSVKDFGAVGDGVTDDTAAIQAAINFADSLGGGVVTFGNGKVYLVSNIILLKTNVSLIGNGCTISVNPLNYTGGITAFYGVFSTVDIISRPLTILWRIGTGVISFENIVIDGFVFNINRDGTVLTSGQIVISDFNAVRFEDSRNCKVTNCRFIDQQISSNSNGTQVVFFVRSDLCEISSCYIDTAGLVFIAESKNCSILNNYVSTSPSTALETLAGSSHVVADNVVNVVWNGVSSIGVNSIDCTVMDNRIISSALTAITLGHPPSLPVSYSLSASASYSTCSRNYVEAGSTLSATHGYIGILVQHGDGIVIHQNTILNLRKKGAYTDRAGGILVQPDAGNAPDIITITDNYVNFATVGVFIVRAKDSFTVSGNFLTDCIAGIHYEVPTTEVPSISVRRNTITTCTHALVFANGYMDIQGNRFDTISSTSYTCVLSRGTVNFTNNTLIECGEVYMSSVKSLRFNFNSIENAIVKTRAGFCFNNNVAGTATMDLIEVNSNYATGVTDVMLLVGVLNQATQTIDSTSPTRYRLTSYNVGVLPTASTGLTAGDLWNSAGVVQVV